jgi:hypothetical protein
LQGVALSYEHQSAAVRHSERQGEPERVNSAFAERDRGCKLDGGIAAAAICGRSQKL